ncbi:MAG TPA: hypothetical protein VJZ73_13780 [Methylomirabilota bacterium]|nr:hypothetical protein [Methylomirabilota bacterium]
MLKGRAKFQKRRTIEGALEIAPRSSDDTRLREWIHESRAVLPRLRALLDNGHLRLDPLHRVVEDLRRRVEALEDDLRHLRAARG